MEEVRKIFIPVRKYGSNIEAEPESRFGDYGDLEEIEPDLRHEISTNDRKIIEKRSIHENVDWQLDEYSLMKTPIENYYPAFNTELISKKFEAIRNDLKKKYETKIKEINKTMNDKIKVLTNEYEVKLKTIDELQYFIQRQIKLVKPPSIEEKKKEQTEVDAPLSKSPVYDINPKHESSNPATFLMSCSTKFVYFTKDLENIQKVELPGYINYKTYFNLLVKNERELYIAKSNGDVIIYNLTTRKSTKISGFSIPRENFSMCYIGEYPGIIGGNCNHNVYPTVEILVDGDWIQSGKLNVPRHSCVSVQHERGTYVFGGKNNKDFVSIIEKFDKDQWIIINVTISNVFDCVACCHENSIYIFGINKHSVIAFDTITEECSNKKPLAKKFSSKQCCKADFTENKFVLLRLSNLIHYPLN